MVNKHHYTTIKLESWQAFKTFVQQFSENWAFRGQADDRWVLNNSIERMEFIRFHKSIEADFVAEFQRGARNYLRVDETPQHLIEWLALMQHHGAPTRLLDLSRSPFIGAYFAFEQSGNYDNDGVAIWGINTNYLKHKALEVLSHEFGNDFSNNNNMIDQAVFERIFFQNNLSLVFPVEPFSMNRRYSLQQSMFISTGISNIPLMDQLHFLGADLEKVVVKMVLSSSHKKEVLRDLQQMNMNRASLFPDLDGYAASLRLRYFSMRSPDETLEDHMRKMEDDNYPFFP